ncbi:hypothetical protein HDU93_003225 [Gonapodya sp. JEL0774]|nr:hypothetical protein HDU93_003225 [Gonapodya sp. JEL0774]
MTTPAKDREMGPPSFSTPEGSYVLRDDIHYELSANPFIGTQFHVIARIELPAAEKAAQSRSVEELPSPGKFTEVTILPDTTAGDKLDRGTMVFFADSKNSPISRRKSSRLGGLLGVGKAPSANGPPTTMVSPPAFKDFVSKVIVNDNVGQIMTDAMESIFMNVGKTFLWVNYSCQPKDPLTCLYFKDSYPTCHDVNVLTRDTLDIVIGFNTGDVMWYSAITGKYVRLNRGGSIISAAVTCIKWMPGSDSTFFAGYDDGTLIVYDKERDDAEKFTPSGPGEEGWDPSQMYTHKWEGKREKLIKHNPVSWHKMSRKPISDIAFSPDCQHIAVACLDGYLKVMEYHSEQLVDTYKSYFGGFLSVAWSPDGKMIITAEALLLASDVQVTSLGDRSVAQCRPHGSNIVGQRNPIMSGREGEPKSAEGGGGGGHADLPHRVQLSLSTSSSPRDASGRFPPQHPIRAKTPSVNARSTLPGSVQSPPGNPSSSFFDPSSPSRHIGLPTPQTPNYLGKRKHDYANSEMKSRERGQTASTSAGRSRDSSTITTSPNSPQQMHFGRTTAQDTRTSAASHSSKTVQQQRSSGLSATASRKRERSSGTPLPAERDHSAEPDQSMILPVSLLNSGAYKGSTGTLYNVLQFNPQTVAAMVNTMNGDDTERIRRDVGVSLPTPQRLVEAYSDPSAWVTSVPKLPAAGQRAPGAVGSAGISKGRVTRQFTSPSSRIELSSQQHLPFKIGRQQLGPSNPYSAVPDAASVVPIPDPTLVELDPSHGIGYKLVSNFDRAISTDDIVPGPEQERSLVRAKARTQSRTRRTTQSPAQSPPPARRNVMDEKDSNPSSTANPTFAVERTDSELIRAQIQVLCSGSSAATISATDTLLSMLSGSDSGGHVGSHRELLAKAMAREGVPSALLELLKRHTDPEVHVICCKLLKELSTVAEVTVGATSDFRTLLDTVLLLAKGHKSMKPQRANISNLPNNGRRTVALSGGSTSAVASVNDLSSRPRRNKLGTGGSVPMLSSASSMEQFSTKRVNQKKLADSQTFSSTDRLVGSRQKLKDSGHALTRAGGSVNNLRKTNSRSDLLSHPLVPKTSEYGNNVLSGLIDRYMEPKFLRDLERMDRTKRTDTIRHLLSLFSKIGHLLTVGNYTSLDQDLEGSLEMMLREGGAMVGAEFAFVYLVDRETGGLVAKQFNLNLTAKEKELFQATKYPAGTGIAGHVVVNDVVINLTDPAEHPLFDIEVDTGGTGAPIHSILCVPIKTRGGSVKGVIEVVNKTAALGEAKPGVLPSFNSDEEFLLSTLAGYAGTIIDIHEHYEAVMRAQKKVEVLLDTTNRLSSTLDLNTLIQRIMAAARELLQADRCTLFLVDNERKQLWSHVQGRDGLQEIRFNMSVGIAGYAATEGVSVNITDAYKDPRFNPEIDRQTGYQTKHILAMPIKNSAGAVLAVTQMINKNNGAGPCFGPDDERLLTAFSAQAAVALEKAEVFKATEEMKVFLQAVLKSITNCVITLSETLRMTSMNRPWVMEALGVSEQFMRDQTIDQWLADTNPHLLKDIKQVYKSDQPTYTSEYELKGPNKSTFVSYQIMPLQSGGKGLVLVFENISSEKRAIQTLGRYMNPALVKQVMQEGGTQLGGVRKKVAILFSDIRSFTSISESLEPHEVVALLNHHFNDAVNAIMAEQGILDKYIGDAVMAVFGVPFVSPEDSIHACAAALRMKEALRLSNETRMATGQKVIKIGIGINTGEVLSGNIGSEKRLEFSCIGDAVNLASRVEGLTKYYGVSILVTEFTKADSGDAFFMREVDTVVVVGKKKPIRLFEVVARRGEEKQLPFEQLRTFDLYIEGLKLYRNRKFQEASERFTRAIDLTNDGPSKTLLNRCKHYLVDPPGDDWNGVYASTEK